MAQAKRIAFGGSRRLRVVTLEGEVIETSGAMSGGGRVKMSGKMGTQIVNKKDDVDLNALERKLQVKPHIRSCIERVEYAPRERIKDLV